MQIKNSNILYRLPLCFFRIWMYCMIIFNTVIIFELKASIYSISILQGNPVQNECKIVDLSYFLYIPPLRFPVTRWWFSVGTAEQICNEKGPIAIYTLKVVNHLMLKLHLLKCPPPFMRNTNTIPKVLVQFCEKGCRDLANLTLKVKLALPRSPKKFIL